MGKRLMVLLAVVCAISFVVPAYAAVQNVKISGDVLMQGVSRTRFGLSDARLSDSSYAFGVRENQSYLSTIARIRLDADLTDGVSAVLRTTTERAWGTDRTGAAATGDNLDLDLAYVTLKDVLNFVTEVNIPLAVMLGRQELHYGNELVIGDSGASSLSGLPYTDLSIRKAFDAIRGVLDYSPVVIDLVVAKAGENAVNRYVKDNNDVDLYGINVNYTGLKNTALEGYYWNRVRGNGLFTFTPDRSTEPEVTQVIGARIQNNSIKVQDRPMPIGLELAYQFGTFIADQSVYGGDITPEEPSTATIYGFKEDYSYKRSAWALQLGTGYTFADKKWAPGLTFDYTYLTGQKGDINAKRMTAWDPMYENQANGTIFNSIFTYSNTHIYHLSASTMPRSDMKLIADWYHARLARHFREGQVPTLGTNSFTMTENSDLFNEFDARLVYDYTEDVQLGLNAGILVPLGAFKDAGYKNEPASQLIGSMKVTF